MIAYLYCYPHPFDHTKFIYTGQETTSGRRDLEHRAARRGFGLRFKNKFPSTELPQPIRKQVDVKNNRELSELETIWMFQYHTWRGYEGGMNLTIPGGEDYKVAGKLGALAQVQSGQASQKGKIQGTKNIQTGHMKRMFSKHGFENGQKLNKWKLENNFNELPQVKEARQRNAKAMGLESARSGRLLKSASKGGKIGGRRNADLGNMEKIKTSESLRNGGIAATHSRWHTARGVVKNTCELCMGKN